jgi:catechol 2,3-dioxygenase-like lactoylglutathione lyase family enzyme
MIFGAHVLLYTKNADADRAFFRDVLGFPHADAGHGWLIFRLPPAEAAVHPLGETGASAPEGSGMAGAHLHLMCDDVENEVKALSSRGVKCTPLQRESWGIRTEFTLPSGGRVGLYQPLHPTALEAR